MKKVILALCLTITALSSDAMAQGRRIRMSSIDACTTVEALPSRNFIYKNSAPVRASSTPGSPIVGFRKEPTLIMNTSYTRSSTSIYDTEGTRIGTCPWATADGHAGGRFRCVMQTASLRRAAVRNTGSPKIFFVVKSRTKFCAEIPDAGRCYGSVKGLCDQVLK